MNHIGFYPSSRDSTICHVSREEYVTQRYLKQGFRIVKVIPLLRDRVKIVATKRFSI